MLHYAVEGDSEGFIFPDGTRYLGEWRTLENGQDIPHGLGTCFYKDGRRFEGEWKNGIPNGKGTLYFPNGEDNTGNWIDGELIERIHKTFVNGDHYSGEFKEEQPDGEGILTKAKGKIFKGKFSKGNFVAGTLILPNGNEYPIIENQYLSKLEREPSAEGENWIKRPENYEQLNRKWMGKKLSDPEIELDFKTDEGDNGGFSDENIVDLAELNPGYGIKRFIKKLYPNVKERMMRRHEYEVIILFSDLKEAFGVDLLNHLEDKKYSKLVNGDEYMRITGNKSLPRGFGRSSSRISSELRKGEPGEGVKVPLPPQEFNWGDIGQQ